MGHNLHLFYFQDVINSIRNEIEMGRKVKCERLLDDIAEDAEFEDLQLYKEYLSLFDVEHDLEDLGLGLHFPSDLTDFEADFMLLLRLVAASFSSTYELEYDNETNLVNLIIMSKYKEKSVTKELHYLLSFKISRLFEIYIEEQLSLETLRLNSDEEKSAIEEERRIRLMVYQKKLQQLKRQLEKKERIQEAQKESGDILSDLDDLLNG